MFYQVAGLIKGFLSGIVVIIFGLGVYLYFHLGFNLPVKVYKLRMEAFYLMYAKHVGPYQEIGPVIDRVFAAANQAHYDCKQFAAFLDNPEEVDEDRLRAWGGCYSNQPFPAPLENFETIKIPPATYVIAEFAGSPALTNIRVIPRVRSFMEPMNLRIKNPVLQIFNFAPEGMSTTYLFPIRAKAP